MRELPADAHERCSGRLYVSLSVRSPTGGGFAHHLVSQYPTRAYVAEALCAACWIPGLTGRLLPLPTLGGRTVMDGTLTATLAPSSPDNPHPTLYVSPFSNRRFDICPEHDGSHLRIRMPTGRELHLNTWCVLPPLSHRKPPTHHPFRLLCIGTSARWARLCGRQTTRIWTGFTAWAGTTRCASSSGRRPRAATTTSTRARTTDCSTRRPFDVCRRRPCGLSNFFKYKLLPRTRCCLFPNLKCIKWVK